MTFSDRVEERLAPLRQAILSHPFTTGIGDGTLELDKFRFYVRQDYLYLIDYSRVLAVASARAGTLDAMGWFARLLHETLNTEMDLHRDFCAGFGVSRQELEATKRAPTTLAYTQFLLSTAHHRPFAELAAALLPCQWGYWEIGDYLNRRGLPSHAPLYSQWIGMYASEEFKALGLWVRKLVDGLAQDQPSPVLEGMEEAYATSLRYELLFWEACYNLETWPPGGVDDAPEP